MDTEGKEGFKERIDIMYNWTQRGRKVSKRDWQESIPRHREEGRFQRENGQEFIPGHRGEGRFQRENGQEFIPGHREDGRFQRENRQFITGNRGEERFQRENRHNVSLDTEGKEGFKEKIDNS